MQDQDYMRRAIKLAKKGTGFTNPNPLVGAVIVKDGHIIGEGYHARYGKPHAERNAIASLTESAEGATLYVTLEPCCHYGKTPPCTEAIIDQKIGKVVIGSRDPNPLVGGKGAALLRQHGIIVEEDFLKEECDELNPVFFHYMTTKTPYVVMKYAMTADGRIATKTGASKWITGEAARQQVQWMRHQYMGILVGIGTVLADDPLLTVRQKGWRSPVRIICDSHLQIPLDCRIVQTASDYPTIVACAAADTEKINQLTRHGIQVEVLPGEDGRVDLPKLMYVLGQQGIDSILVEGGSTLNDSLRRAGLIHQLEVFVAPKLFGGTHAKSPVEGAGIAQVADATEFCLKNIQQFGQDVLLTYQYADH